MGEARLTWEAVALSDFRRRIVTFYWDNIDRRLIEGQRAVFTHLGYEIQQVCRTGMSHGDFLDEVFASLAGDEVLLTVDIDCIPLNREIVEHAFAVAEAGGVIGGAQVSSHIDSTRIFTAPLFLAISQKTWAGLGRPSFAPNPTCDVAQHMHDLAVGQGVAVEYIMPWACLIPRWNLAGQVLYGTGTFYRGGLFHLYESRNSPYAFAFHEVVADVLAGRETDILALCSRTMRLFAFERPMKKWARFKKFRKLRRFVEKLRGAR